MAKAPKAPTLWLVREHKKCDGWYYVYSGDKPRKPEDGWGEGAIIALCPEAWEEHCPKALHLRYGGGPIHIVVQRGCRTK